MSEVHMIHVLASKMSILNYLLIDPTERARLGIQVSQKYIINQGWELALLIFALSLSSII